MDTHNIITLLSFGKYIFAFAFAFVSLILILMNSVCDSCSIWRYLLLLLNVVLSLVALACFVFLL